MYINKKKKCDHILTLRLLYNYLKHNRYIGASYT